MRLSIAIEIADGKCQPLSVAADGQGPRYSDPLATFIAQLAAAYLPAEVHPPATAAHDKAIVSYRAASRDDVILDRSV